MRRGLARALLSGALALFMVVASGVASAAPDSGGEAPMSLPDGLQVGGMKVLAVERSGPVTTLTLEPKDAGRAAAAQLVTCTVYNSGPYSNDGVTVYFNVDVYCDAVVDRLTVQVGMVMFITGSGYFAVPGSYEPCDLLATDQLLCTSTSSCYFADYYYGIGYVQAYLDEFYDELYLETAPRPLACAV